MPSNVRPMKEHSPSQQWSNLKLAPERYAIIQLGISLFESASSRSIPNQVSSSDGSRANLDWIVRRYNFYVFPAEINRFDKAREVTLSPGAVAFLNQHNMNWNLWMTQGVPYQTAQKAKDTLQQFVDKYALEMKQETERDLFASFQNESVTIAETARRRVELRRPEDIAFCARAMASLREWMDAAHPVGTDGNAGFENGYIDTVNMIDIAQAEACGKSMLLPACNSFLRRALYESIEKEYPSLDLEPAGAEFPNQIRVWRLTSEEKSMRRRQLREDDWNALLCSKIGMWRVIEAISRICRGETLDRTSALFAKSFYAINWENAGQALDVTTDPLGMGPAVPVVVHNGFMDLCFIISHMHTHTLPSQLCDCKGLIHQYFPTIYDTKVLSTECSTIWNNESSNLSNLFQRIIVENGNNLQERILVIQADHSVQEHEASFDAYMTGCVYVRLCNHIRETYETADLTENDPLFGNLIHLSAKAKESEARKLYARNKLYQMSMFTLDLEANEDPLSRGMQPETTFRVSGIDTAVATRDIVQCLSDLQDSKSRRVDYEIIWIDDTTFLVAASFRPPLQIQLKMENLWMLYQNRITSLSCYTSTERFC